MDNILGEKLLRICEMTDARLRAMTPADRDRLLQAHLAATRSPSHKLLLLCSQTDALAPIRRDRISQGRQP